MKIRIKLTPFEAKFFKLTGKHGMFKACKLMIRREKYKWDKRAGKDLI